MIIIWLLLAFTLGFFAGKAAAIWRLIKGVSLLAPEDQAPAKLMIKKLNQKLNPYV